MDSTSSQGQWTVDTLREHTGAMFREQQRHVDAMLAAQISSVTRQFESQKEAVLKQEAASEKRFEGVNEFRLQLGDQQRTLIPRSEFEVTVKNFSEKLAVLEARINQGSGWKDGVGWVVGIIGVIGAVVTMIVMNK